MKQSYWKSWAGNLQTWSDLTLTPSFLLIGLILKNKMGTTGVSLSVIKSTYISLITGPRVLGW